MRGDDMRAKERAWLVAGFAVIEQERANPLLLLAEGERPVLVLPAGLDVECREMAFGWAYAEFAEQFGGWLFVVQRLGYFAAELGRIASALAAVGMVALIA